MGASDVQLNLARKWRSRTFEQIVGQELSVRMLKNSLYLGHYFPVYLFAGQRGCGKTSTARVFAAALNCEQLTAFRQDPKAQAVPCQQCASCVAMRRGAHPDFIEMDAASHTGVDHVRQIIEASSLMPVMGVKRVYLIDEAHMLSKAAFNAFLKILEEPPNSVLFILATTDPQKIIETVRSRCFQLSFGSIDHDQLVSHLKSICDQEKIAYEDEALEALARESGGAARDAINLLEQVRFSAPRVSPDAVCSVLGRVADALMVQLFECVVQGDAARLLACMQDEKLASCDAQVMWATLVEMVQAALWAKHGVVQKRDVWQGHKTFQRLVGICSPARLIAMLDMFCQHEFMFARSLYRRAVLEMVLLKLCAAATENASVAPANSSRSKTSNVVRAGQVNRAPVAAVKKDAGPSAAWRAVLAALERGDDPLLSSIFQQGTVKTFDEQAGKLDVQFSASFALFQEYLLKKKQTWGALLTQHFGRSITFEPSFAGGGAIPGTSALKTHEAAAVPSKQQPSASQPSVRTVQSKRLDVSDKKQWPKTNAVLEQFPGTVTEIVEGAHE